MDTIPGTKEIILKNALSLFSRRGFESTGIQELVNEAGITKPTLYYYFGSKQGLLEAIVTEYGGALLEITRRASQYNHDLVMNLTGLFQDIIQYAFAHPDYFRLMLDLFSSAPETSGYAAGNGLRKALVSIIESLFALASGDHGNMKDRQKMYAETFFGLIETWALLALNGEMELSSHIQYRIVHQYMHGIFS
ncbi:hypothetical protein FACS1894124_3660 [Spirochaetia bacterium]|nr:hypothetical protein FACS1894124_3660 [Spirochaetia bacterium]